DGVMVDGVVVNGKPVTAILDTGSNGTFAVSPMGIDLLRLADLVARSVATRSVGYNGEFETHEGHLGNVVIGDISVENGGVKYFGKGSGHDSARWELNIGNVFLKNYVVTIDYPKKKI